MINSNQTTNKIMRSSTINILINILFWNIFAKFLMDKMKKFYKRNKSEHTTRETTK